ncbi:hypothetical protein Tco_0840609 [Tanacetum coccineum]|uniref:Reverse transcriptase domain-containing protein n=1 Tax=Tanacetum coccineum TaxID=301880 RepID=A0ABQ5AX10_9ASTR
MSTLQALIKQLNERSGTMIQPIRLSFDEEDRGDKGKGVDKGSEEKGEDDLQKPYKEVLKPPFTRRIVEFSAPSVDNQEEWEILLKRQLEAALESGKLSHLVKDKRKSRHDTEENWMNIPITFPPVLADDVTYDPLIVEAEVEGYLVGLEVAFGSEGIFRRTMMKFIIVRASSPYNIILGRTEMRELRNVSSTIHAMMKFPTPRGIETLVIRTSPVYECRWS